VRLENAEGFRSLFNQQKFARSYGFQRLEPTFAATVKEQQENPPHSPISHSSEYPSSRSEEGGSNKCISRKAG
jgi:hypothetical protein